MLITKRDLLKTSSLFLIAPVARFARASNTQTAVQTSVAKAINRAAYLGALSQRYAKAFCQLQQDILPDSARHVLGSAQQALDSGFDDLARANLPSGLRGQLDTLHQHSDSLTAQMSNTPTLQQAVKVSQQADKLQAAADELATSIESSANHHTSKVLYTAGHQRGLSQRMAKNYFLAAVGHRTAASNDQLAADQSEFKKALAELIQTPVSTAAIRNELQLTQSQWLFFEAALRKKADPIALRDVATTSERLLEVSDNLTLHYEHVVTAVLGAI